MNRWKQLRDSLSSSEAVEPPLPAEPEPDSPILSVHLFWVTADGKQHNLMLAAPTPEGLDVLVRPAGQVATSSSTDSAS